MPHKKLIYRAGIILYNKDDGLQVLTIKPVYKDTGLWQLPKGKLKKDEDTLEGAIRETEEETGLFIGNLLERPRKIGQFLGRTTFFVAPIKDKTLFGPPRADEIEDTRWMTPEEFYNEGRELHHPVLKAAVRFIGKDEKKLNSY
jgi:8-oxo-dGTP pyrophosphatase MutT (NUDIX family)